MEKSLQNEYLFLESERCSDLIDIYESRDGAPKEAPNELARILEAAYRYGYVAGHDDTKEGTYKEPKAANVEMVPRLTL